MARLTVSAPQGNYRVATTVMAVPVTIALKVSTATVLPSPSIVRVDVKVLATVSVQTTAEPTTMESSVVEHPISTPVYNNA